MLEMSDCIFVNMHEFVDMKFLYQVVSLLC